DKIQQGPSIALGTQEMSPLTMASAYATFAAGGVRTVGWGDRPELARACRLSMAIAMLAMLMTL
ncbi:hypothetical protein ACWEQU_34495, partial [Streptomyces nodosus]